MSRISNATESCWSIPAVIPQAWTTTNVTDPFYNVTGCAVPACEENASILASCSNVTVDELSPFNSSIDDPYFSYILPNKPSPASYQAYQNCLLDKNATHFLCSERSYKQGYCVGSGNGVTTPRLNPPKDGKVYQVCTTPTSNDNIRVMESCCSSFENVGGLQAELGGCQVSCIAKYAGGQTLAGCLYDTHNRLNVSMTYICWPSDPDVKAGKTVSSSASSSHICRAGGRGLTPILLLGLSFTTLLVHL